MAVFTHANSSSRGSRYISDRRLNQLETKHRISAGNVAAAAAHLE